MGRRKRDQVDRIIAAYVTDLIRPRGDSDFRRLSVRNLEKLPGFVWMIAIGFALPSSTERSSPTAELRAAGRGM